MSETHRVFVYGTLMRGEHHHDVLQGSVFEGEGCTEPLFRLMWMEYYPALVAGGAQAVRGEVYRVSTPTLALLDELEEHPDVYLRTEVRLADGTSAQAYVLHAAQLLPDAELIPGGDFRTLPPVRRRP